MSCSCWCWNMVVSACDVPCMHAFFYIYGHLELEVVRQLLLQSGADKECDSLDDCIFFWSPRSGQTAPAVDGVHKKSDFFPLRKKGSNSGYLIYTYI